MISSKGCGLPTVDRVMSEGRLAPSRGLRLEQSQRIRFEPRADGFCERGIAPGRGQGQGLLEMGDGFSRFPLVGQRHKQLHYHNRFGKKMTVPVKW